MRRIAVIGSGVSGLTSAYLLSRENHVTLYEADTRLGGHTHTHTVEGPDGPIRVDTGFIVHNDRTYPHLLRLFAELGVETRDTEMSMSISDPASGIEYAGGRGLIGFVARPLQFLRRDYLSTLTSVKRFHALAADYLATSPEDDLMTYGEFIKTHGFGQAFTDLYAVPLVSCVWSCGREDALAYPAKYLFAFLDHHGMLSVTGSPSWRTVVGGSSAYVEKIAARLHEVRIGRGATSVVRDTALNIVQITDTTRACETFDAVVVATHADHALALLADPSPAEKELLGAFRYSHNHTVLHQDPSLMPRTRSVRSAWNFRVADGSDDAVLVTYWMNRLQGLDERVPLFVTLNGGAHINPDTIIAEMDYTHPIYEPAALAAQRRLGELNTSMTAFAGAYQGWGFHEDGARSGVAAAQALGVSW